MAGIDGVSLLGIFGSGEVAGVIIRLDNGERQRCRWGSLSRAGHCSHWESRRAMLRQPRVSALCLRWLCDGSNLERSRTGCQQRRSERKLSPNAAEGEPSQADSKTDAADAVPQRIDL